MKLQTRIFAGLLVGATAGTISKAAVATPLRDGLIAIEPIGTAFIRLITMVVVPLVIGSLFTGIASLGDPRRLGRIGGRTLAYFLGTTFAAAVIGLCVARAMPFGLVPTLGAGKVTPTGAIPTLAESLLAIIPQNPFGRRYRAICCR